MTMPRCTNSGSTCGLYDCPLKGDGVPSYTNCSKYLVEHMEEMEDAAREFEIDLAKRLRSRTLLS